MLFKFSEPTSSMSVLCHMPVVASHGDYLETQVMCLVPSHLCCAIQELVFFHRAPLLCCVVSIWGHEKHLSHSSGCVA